MKKSETPRRERPAAVRRATPRPSDGPLRNDLGQRPIEGALIDLRVGPDEIPEHLFRRLLGAYLSGAREFVLRERPAISSGTREVVRSFCRRTRQPEIVSDEGGVLRLRDLAFESPISLEQRIARMGRMVLEVHREAVRSWQHLPLGEDGHWERRDDEIDREAWYIQRIASLGLTLDRPDPQLLGAWTVARSLERIADHAVVLGTVGPRLVDLPNGAGPATSLRQFHAQAMDHLEGILGATDPDAVNGLLDTGEALMASGHSLADRLLPAVGGGTMPPATAAAVARLLESIGRTVAYAQDIAQVVLDRPSPIAVGETTSDGFLSAPAP
ncbi:MAG TPA: PhoU domain-containing protein [Thermoplasmata archaeon]|nr:PhoU domain-containing protein [Thermoplasmata archaeon]